MIDITKAVAKQHTGANGVLSPWEVSLDGEVLYTLPRETTVEDTFTIRNNIDELLKGAYSDGIKESTTQWLKVNEETEKNQRKAFELLKEENLRLATALEQHIISEEN